MYSQIASTNEIAIPGSNFDEGIRTVSQVDTGESLHTLMKLSYFHLFSVELIAFGIGFIFRLLKMNNWFKVMLIVVLFLAILTDIFVWFLTKWGPTYA